MGFEEHVEARVRKALAGLRQRTARDAYAVSFLLDEERHEADRPQLVVNVNTERRVREAREHLVSDDEDEAEDDAARWDHAHWRQGEGDVTIPSGEDGRALRSAWVDEHREGFAAWQAARGERLLGDAPPAAGGPLPESPFRDLCAQIARRLHDDGTIERTFGRPVPVVLHDLVDDEGVLELNRRANPPELLAGFERFRGRAGA